MVVDNPSMNESEQGCRADRRSLDLVQHNRLDEDEAERRKDPVHLRLCEGAQICNCSGCRFWFTYEDDLMKIKLKVSSSIMRRSADLDN
ncbi:hypothetical protein E3N88_36158 [Mikania micrantha]|uniref:Uncharacterized protein n=1 Tax=Mikania micrantha TaxID=192012 RepID=A0A5N6M3C3_9ASTR|nr:hypothetical protein E3N88_36158 [Mikania micrantha]